MWRSSGTNVNSKAIKRARPAAVNAAELEKIRETVSAIIADITENGDAAVRKYSDRFDSWNRESFLLDEERIADIVDGIPAGVLDDIRFAQQQIQRFARHQRDSLKEDGSPCRSPVQCCHVACGRHE